VSIYKQAVFVCQGNEDVAEGLVGDDGAGNRITFGEPPPAGKP